MKCPRCFSLNCATDNFCIGCRGPLAPVRAAMVKEKVLAATPQFAYFFAAVCGAIPIATLGGIIPIVLGLGGAGVCMGVSRAFRVPAPIRFMVCLGIAIFCWVVFVAIVITMYPAAKKRFESMFQ